MKLYLMIVVVVTVIKDHLDELLLEPPRTDSSETSELLPELVTVVRSDDSEDELELLLELVTAAETVGSMVESTVEVSKRRDLMIASVKVSI